MSDLSVPKQEFAIRNLKTKSVTLYPAKAHVVRDIQHVTIQPGLNQVIIVGLTPTVDEDSIKVDGTGAAVITNLSVESIPNPEKFDDIYPPDVEEDKSDDDEAGSESESEECNVLRGEIKSLQHRVAEEGEKLASATKRLAILDKYGDTVSGDKQPENVEDFLQDYKSARIIIFRDHNSASDETERLNSLISSAQKKIRTLVRAAAKIKEKAMREKAKNEKKTNEAKKEEAAKKAKLRSELAKFWPRKVFKITVSLETPTAFTPGSSRRNSLESLVKIPREEESTSSATENTVEISLTLSYITAAASWLPRYDLSLNSVTATALLEYSAELRNTTSETWTDARIVLSTSQTTYSGLGEEIPKLQAWHLRLAKKGASFEVEQDGALYSNHEKEFRTRKLHNSTQTAVNRHDMFGTASTDGFYRESHQQQRLGNSNVVSQPSSAVFGLASSRPQAPNLFASLTNANALSQQGALFGTTSSGGLFGGSSIGALGSTTSVPSQANSGLQSAPSQSTYQPQQIQQQPERAITHARKTKQTMFGRVSPSLAPLAPQPTGVSPGTRSRVGGNLESTAFDYEAEELQGLDDETLATDETALMFEESTFEESGLTTTYDLPGLKTLTPTSIVSKHRIARIDFKAVVFSHVLVPKLKAAAFLKARLRNASKITLLRGTTGLTLDGSFLGQSTIPRCSSGDVFTLPLGIDPAISVSYAKPTVRRSQSGIFNKEDSEVFTRTAIVTNTKNNSIVDITVVDQVPVSEDERLKIDIISPRGLRVGGEPVAAGTPTVSDSTVAKVAAISSASTSRLSVYGDDGKSGKWGNASAVAKKGGEISWVVKINPSRGCKLVLEYEASYPNGDRVIGT